MVHIQDTALGAGAWLLPLEPRPPVWVSALGAQGQVSTVPCTHAAVSDVRTVSPLTASNGALFHAAAAIPDADRLDAAALEAAVTAAYLAIAGVIARDGRHAIRFWNFIPGIHADMGGGRDRYMVFNAGRFKAFTEWYGPRDAFSRALPTASAVGIREGALVIHAVAGEAPGLPIENPRQVPAYSYSERYGPLPPCFARATLVESPADDRGRLLLVGGTASILGEDSIHRDVRAQTSETFENLSKLLAAARSTAGASEVDASEVDADIDIAASLAAFSTLRVYIVRPEDADVVREMVTANVPRTTSVEFAQADLCRQELLVEIEGVARL
jgi:chorismate lyase/3-hydroxybenzoate synthase